jgi:hypothetical protein
MVTACLLLSESFDPESPMTALNAEPFLGLGLLQRPPIADFSPYYRPPVSRLSVPSAIADFFVEGFAVDQPERTRVLSNKEFRRSVTLKFCLPAILPINVVSERSGFLTFGFYDSPILSATETGERVSAILSVIAAKKVTVAEFTNVDQTVFTTAEIAKFAAEYDLILLKMDGPADPALETQNFTLRVLQSHWSRSRDQDVRVGFKNLFECVYLAFCKNCQMLFGPGDSSETACVTYRHKGKQIEILPGQMEVVDVDENNQPIMIVNWTCCGEVPADDRGCERIVGGAHVIDPAKKNFSRLSVSEELTIS